jgi:hypothetical protein
MAFIYVDKSSRVNSTFYRNIKDFLLELWVICVGKYVSINPYSFFEVPITIFFSNIPKLILYFSLGVEPRPTTLQARMLIIVPPMWLYNSIVYIILYRIHIKSMQLNMPQ